jgi:hypothetical protein
MSIAQSLFAEFQEQVPITRRFLETSAREQTRFAREIHVRWPACLVHRPRARRRCPVRAAEPGAGARLQQHSAAFQPAGNP